MYYKRWQLKITLTQYSMIPISTMFMFVVLLLTVLANVGFSLSSAPDIHRSRRLIIDTDAGSDDAVAILNLLGAENLGHKVKTDLITTTNGNARVEQVCRNVLKILKTIQRLDIPIYKGCNRSIVITPYPGYYFGKDGFGDFEFVDPPADNLLQKEHAVNALIRVASESPGELSLVSLGPLTNIAMALRLDPQFLDNLSEIYIMGGSDSGVGNVRPGIEYNFNSDPEAAYIVLKEAERIGKILNVVTLETVSERNPLEMIWRKECLGNMNTTLVKLINNAERLTLNGDKWDSADAVLSAVVLDEDIIEDSETVHGDVELCGNHGRAALFLHRKFSWSFTKNIRIIRKINTDKFKNMLMKNLSERAMGHNATGVQ